MPDMRKRRLGKEKGKPGDEEKRNSKENEEMERETPKSLPLFSNAHTILLIKAGFVNINFTSSSLSLYIYTHIIA